MRIYHLPALILLWSAAGHAQGPADEAGPRPAPPAAKIQLIEFTGIVTYIDVEGGFYGIAADNGDKFNPLYLPELFKQDGLRVRATAELRNNMLGIHQWGRYVHVVHIVPSACLDEMRKIGDN